MSNLVLELGNANNWESIFSQTYSAQPVPDKPNTYYPLPEITIPILLDRRILAIHAYSPSAAPHWKFAGYLNQKVQTGLTVGGMTDSYAQRKKLWLNQINLIILPFIASTYAISFSIPYWILNIQLVAWKYIGSESYSTEDLIEQLRIDVLRVESKVDNIEQWG